MYVENNFTILPVSVDLSPIYYSSQKVRCVEGNEYNWLSDDAKESFETSVFYITVHSDRMGYALHGNRLAIVNNRQLISSAVTKGTVQLLPSGDLIVLMADHQTTGGYPKIAHVISADMPKLAQTRPNETVQFELINHSEAEYLYIEQQQYLQQLQDTITLQLRRFFLLMHTIDLNCDMGEGMPYDADIMPYISSVNIACGYHAGNEEIMKKTVGLALHHNVAIGAHPGFADQENFGRREIYLLRQDYYNLIIGQLMILKKITDSFNTTIHHVKPHGALYNMSARDKILAAIIAQAVKDFDDRLILYGLSRSESVREAKALDLQTANEVFADRTYQDDGTLTPRSHSNALIEDEYTSLQQILQMITQKTVASVNNKTISIIAETICIHGDGHHAVEFTQLIHQSLKQNNIEIRAC